MKKIFSLFLCLLMAILVLPFNAKSYTTAEKNDEKYCNTNSNNSLNYDIIIEDNIVEYNDEIHINFVVNNTSVNYEVSLINYSFTPLKRISSNNQSINRCIYNQ